jgi:hypothetical protein
VKIIKNFLDKEIFLKCKEALFGELPWYYRGELVDNKKNHYYFTHSFARHNLITSPVYENIIIPFIKRLKMSYIFEIRANLALKTDQQIFSGFHVDTNKSSTTAIFYLNNNNGYTMVGEEEKVEAEANKMLIFDSQTQHGGMTQTDTKRRIVINFNYTPYENIEQ